MIFSLEVLQAQQGDCMILHYGDPNSPGLIVIDGGPSGIYSEYLKPRLEEIRQSLGGDVPLPLTMVMVSHADDDHINGILSMSRDLVSQMDENEPLKYKVDNFWFNSFDDIIGNQQISTIASLQLLPKSTDGHISANIASTNQGRKIRDNANKLGWLINDQFTKLGKTNDRLVRGDTHQSKVSIDNLNITVIHPNESRLIELQKQWDKDLKKAKASGDNSILIASLTSIDKSPFNLSSIVCLVEFDGESILLTGDGRCDDIYDGLKRNGFLTTTGKLHVDILKIPHHGSNANMKPEFFENITADHYVISADGKHNNPDKETLDMIAETIKKGTLYLTNHEGDFGLKDKLDEFTQHLVEIGSSLQVRFRESDKPSLVINLLDEPHY